MRVSNRIIPFSEYHLNIYLISEVNSIIIIISSSITITTTISIIIIVTEAGADQTRPEGHCGATTSPGGRSQQ